MAATDSPQLTTDNHKIMKQKIIVTALPNGNGLSVRGRGTILKASAAISLQVETVDKAGTRLSDVKDMLNWAELIKNAKFLVQYNGNTVEAKVTGAAVDTVLWKNLFSPTVKVSAFVQEELHNMPIVSYPVKHVLTYIKAVVEQTGKKFANDLPDSTFYTENPILTAVSDYSIADYPAGGKERVQITMDSLVKKANPDRLLFGIKERKFIPFAAQPSPAADFAQLKNFHGLYNKKPIETYIPVQKPDFEFHDILSIISNYPQLQRKLGLVIDFEFVAADDKIVPATNANLRIIPTGINFSVPTTILCPGTAYTRTANGFYAKPENGSPIDKGHLKINTDAFTVFQLDTDGAALKLCQQVDALQLKKAKHIFYAVENKMPNAAFIPIINNELPKKEGLPSNRTTGIAVAKNGMAEKLNIRFNRMNELKSKLATGKPAPAGVTGNNAAWILPADLLTADDVNLGYRMDIQPEGSQWFSLHKRLNKYSFINSAGTAIEIPGTEPEEGFMQTSASEEKTDTGKQLKVGEAIARWEGWSLSVPRPGSALNDPLLDKKEVYNKNDAGDKKLEQAKYLTPKDADFKLNVIPSLVKGSLPMLRFGKKYAAKIRTVDLAGNSVAVTTAPENSNECIKADIKYMRYEPVDAPFLVLGNEIKDGESGEVMVIRSNEGVTPTQYENANIDSFHGKAMSGEAVRHVKPPRTTVEMATIHGMLDNAMGTANTATAQIVYDKIKNDKDPAFENGSDMYKMKVQSGNDSLLKVDYLVDPMAAGVAFFVSNNDPNPKLPDPSILNRWVSFYFDPADDANLNSQPLTYDKWMDPKTFRIRLLEGDPNIKWEQSSRTLLLTLQKGAIVKLNYACFWKPDDIIKYAGVLDIMNMTNLSDAVGQRISKGQHWMFSPWRELTLVHAVQQPISNVAGKKYPQIAAIAADRNYTDDFAMLNSKFSVHGPSTGQLDIEAAWTEPVDDITKEKMEEINVKAKVFHYTTLYPVFDYVFGELVKNNPFPGIKHVFNDTKHRKIIYKTIATTRYKENFFNLIKDKEKINQVMPLTRESDATTKIIIPSSARPVAPEVAYIIPTFEWDRLTKGSTIFTGRASGLRIYLKRPWFNSGEGEQLAVIVGYPGLAKDAPYTTWGTDPTKISAKLEGGYNSTTPTTSVFLKPDTVINTPLTVESDGGKINFVGGVAYNVGLHKYDMERQLYYVDIMLNISFAYFPFIKLALARYQEHSVRKEGKDCCLSPIVVTDYVQVPPPRASSLETKGSKDNIVVAISGTVPAVSNAGSMFRTKVEFIIEPIEVAVSDSTHISLATKPIDSYSYVLQESDIKNFAFYHAHPFNLPVEYASKPYRVKVLEYEMIEYDRLKPNPNPGGVNLGTMPTKDRLVFADVYEVNK